MISPQEQQARGHRNELEGQQQQQQQVQAVHHHLCQYLAARLTSFEWCQERYEEGMEESEKSGAGKTWEHSHASGICCPKCCHLFMMVPSLSVACRLLSFLQACCQAEKGSLLGRTPHPPPACHLQCSTALLLLTTTCSSPSPSPSCPHPAPCAAPPPPVASAAAGWSLAVGLALGWPQPALLAGRPSCWPAG